MKRVGISAMDARHFTEKSFSLEEGRKRVDLRLEEELTEEVINIGSE